MKFLLCSDGTPAAEKAIHLGTLLTPPLSAEVTLLGIAEKSADENPLRDALQKETKMLGDRGVATEIVLRSGEPVREILDQTSKARYDMVIIGARWTGQSGHYWRSQRTYDVIKAITPPVMVAIGDCQSLQRFLVCTGGKQFIEQAVRFTGKIAIALGASVTLLHVMAEPPAIYANLVSLEEDVDHLLESGSELGKNLRQQKKELERLGVSVLLRIRHGIVTDQVFEEARTGDYDLIVTGTSHARGLLGNYIMGDVTRSILNRADCSVLVARAGKARKDRTIGAALKRLLGPRGEQR